MDSLGEELVRLRAQIDALEADFCRKAREFQRQGGHLACVVRRESAETSAWRHWRSSRQRSGG